MVDCPGPGPDQLHRGDDRGPHRRRLPSDRARVTCNSFKSRTVRESRFRRSGPPPRSGSAAARTLVQRLLVHLERDRVTRASPAPPASRPRAMPESGKQYPHRHPRSPLASYHPKSSVSALRPLQCISDDFPVRRGPVDPRQERNVPLFYPVLRPDPYHPAMIRAAKMPKSQDNARSRRTHHSFFPKWLDSPAARDRRSPCSSMPTGATPLLHPLLRRLAPQVTNVGYSPGAARSRTATPCTRVSWASTASTATRQWNGPLTPRYPRPRPA